MLPGVFYRENIYDNELYYGEIMKKNDLILIGGILLIAFFSFVIIYFSGRSTGSSIKISVDGKSYGTYSLDEDNEIEIKTEYGNNVVTIKDGVAYMSDADCPDKYCMRQGKINHMKENIVCLPHKVIVEVTQSSNEDSQVDIVFKIGEKKMSKRVAKCGLLIALAMVFSYVEVLIPFNFGIPGIKLGLANLIVVVGFYSMKTTDVIAVSLVRIFLSGLLFGNLMSILYSLSGGILSIIVMLLLKRLHKFSIVGVSIAGGVFHNIGQIIVAMLILENFAVAVYLPPLFL